MKLKNKIKNIYKNSPSWVESSVKYLAIMGSHAYGCHSTSSDYDVYGFCIPPRDIVFPFENNVNIYGFHHQPNNFKHFQAQEDDLDFSVYSIVRYFHLCMDCNPNMIDSMFVPDNCVVLSTPVSDLVRLNRKLFLSKKAWHTFKGYSYSQMEKMKNKNPVGKRLEIVKQYGYDIKFAYHVVRLLDEVEQILELGDIDIQRDRERLKSIRAGQWTIHEIQDFFKEKEKSLEISYTQSKLPYNPQVDKIKELLLNCLEMEYGTIDRVIKSDSSNLINELQQVLDKYKT